MLLTSLPGFQTRKRFASQATASIKTGQEAPTPFGPSRRRHRLQLLPAAAGCCWLRTAEEARAGQQQPGREGTDPFGTEPYITVHRGGGGGGGVCAATAASVLARQVHVARPCVGASDAVPVSSPAQEAQAGTGTGTGAGTPGTAEPCGERPCFATVRRQAPACRALRGPRAIPAVVGGRSRGLGRV